MMHKKHINIRKVICVIAHEKNYETYQYVKTANFLRKIFLLSKLLYQILRSVYLIKPKFESTELLFHVSGANQRRLHKLVASAPNEAFNELRSQYSNATFDNEFTLKYFNIWQFLHLSSLLLITMFSRRPGKRLLLLYLAMFSYVRSLIHNNYSNLKCFVSYNDQPVISACLVLCLKETGCRTIVFQHGLVYRKFSTFPCNSHEFWAWGQIVKNHFSSSDGSTTFKVTGRFSSDKYFAHFQREFSEQQPNVLLIALGWRWSEMIRELQSLKYSWKFKEQSPDLIYMKLHPSVKFKMLFRIYLKLFFSEIIEERRYIEEIIQNFTHLYTVNSTLILDFLLAQNSVLLSDKNALPKEIVDCCTSLANFHHEDIGFTQKTKSERSKLLLQYFNINLV
jgi:hypothetical protein